jgi:hypothetical protein
MRLINHTTERTVSTLSSRGSALDQVLSGVASAWEAQLAYYSLLFGFIMAKTWATRRTKRIPLIEVIFRDGENLSQSLNVGYD